MNRRGIRFQITALASAAVALALLVAGGALVLLQRSELRRSIDATLAQRADDLSALISSGPLLPDAFAGRSPEGFAALIGSDGEVLVATPNLDGDPPPWTALAPGPGDTLQTVRGLDDEADDVFRVLSRPLDGVGLLHVGSSYDVIEDSSTALIVALAITIPALVAALAILVWWLVGRTLRPVEDIRSEVAEIGSTDLQRRVTRPGTKDEIDRLAATMNEMLERLEVSVRHQQRFVADASHELRSPLTRLRSKLEVEIPGSVKEQTVLQDLLGEVIGLQHMVEDLLHLARADESRGTGDFARLDLDDLVIRETRRIRDRERVTVDISDVSGAHVLGDAGQLSRAIRNLLDQRK